MVTNDHEYVPLVVSTSLSFPHSWLVTGFVTRLTRRVPLVEQELLTLPEHLSSLPVFGEVRVTRSLVLRECFVERCLSLCTSSFGHCVVCSSSIYEFWYHQTLLLVIRCQLIENQEHFLLQCPKIIFYDSFYKKTIIEMSEFEKVDIYWKASLYFSTS
jgi:hypothetical protein